MQPVCRIGDTGSHGGAITTASTNILSNGLGVARNGDTYVCDIHGTQSIIATGNVLANGLPVAVVGDEATCGSILSVGSPNVTA
jgi:uncharacterized Zn-binding protein involved in type VI secretion